jgi:hypothetical protein
MEFLMNLECITNRSYLQADKIGGVTNDKINI